MGLELDSVVMVSFIIPTKLSREVTAKIRSLIRKEVDKWCDDYNLEILPKLMLSCFTLQSSSA